MEKFIRNLVVLFSINLLFCLFLSFNQMTTLNLVLVGLYSTWKVFDIFWLKRLEKDMEGY